MYTIIIVIFHIVHSVAADYVFYTTHTANSIFQSDVWTLKTIQSSNIGLLET